MEIKQLFDALDQQLASKQTAREFDKAKEHHPALQSFATVDELAWFLGRQDVSDQDKAQQDAVLRTLIAKAQGRKSSCWSALLLKVHSSELQSTFGFQVRRLPQRMTAEELGLLVIESFLEVVDRFSKTESEGVSKDLISQTRLLLQKEVRGEKKQEAREVLVDDYVPDRVAAKTALENHAADKDQPLVDRVGLIDQVQHFLTDDELQLLTATFGEGRSVVVWARQRAANDDPEEFDRTCSNLRKRRSRLVALLRQQVEQLEAVVAQLEEEGRQCAA
jgi:hypothetical protein